MISGVNRCQIKTVTNHIDPFVSSRLGKFLHDIYFMNNWILWMCEWFSEVSANAWMSERMCEWDSQSICEWMSDWEWFDCSVCRSVRLSLSQSERYSHTLFLIFGICRYMLQTTCKMEKPNTYYQLPYVQI